MKSLKSSSLFINGIIAIVIGLIFVFTADKAIEGILSIFGLGLGIAGVVMLAKHFLIDRKKTGINNFLLFEALFNLILGIIIFIMPSIMVNFVMFLIGLWALLIGLMQIVYFTKIKSVLKNNYLILSSGLLFAILGVVLIFNPSIIVSTIAIIIGIVIFIIGLILIYFGYLIHKNRKSFTDYKIVE
jgi:uncharacterized membrane protein HdeD (DUF308 family)